MDISVIIPTYNRAGLLERALNSVYSQTYIPLEIIVVDDGSTDHTAALLRERFPHVVYLQQSNQGVSRARNLGIERARGEWLAFLDSDDEWLPQKLARQSRALGCKPSYRICHSDEIWIRRGRRVNPMRKHAKHGGDVFYLCLPRCVISPSSVLIHRHVFAKVGVFDNALPVCEDYDLWLRICALYPVLYVPDALLVKYGGHDDQLSRRHWGMDRFRIQALEKMLSMGGLSTAHRNAVLDMLLEKLNIVLKGARKHNNVSLVRDYSVKRLRYQQLLDESRDPLVQPTMIGRTP